MTIPGKRPYRRPVDFRLRVEPAGNPVVWVTAGVDLLGIVKLPVTEQLHFVRVDRLLFAGAQEVRKAPPAADFVAVECSTVALQGLAQRAGFGLPAGAALACALASQAAPQRAQFLAPQCNIAAGPVDVQPGIGFLGGACQPGHDTAYGADKVTITGQGLRRRNRAQTAAVGNPLWTWFQTHRDRRPVRAKKRFIPAGETLRPAHGRMVFGLKANGIQRDDPIMNGRQFGEDQPLGNLGRHQGIYRIQHRGMGRARHEGAITTGVVAQEAVNFLMPLQAIGETGPARSLPPGSEYRAEQRLHAVRLDQHPRRFGLQKPPVDVRKPLVQVIGADCDGKRRPLRIHANADGLQAPGKPAVIAAYRHCCRPQALFGPTWRSAERRPVGRC